MLPQISSQFNPFSWKIKCQADTKDHYKCTNLIWQTENSNSSYTTSSSSWKKLELLLLLLLRQHFKVWGGELKCIQSKVFPLLLCLDSHCGNYWLETWSSHQIFGIVGRYQRKTLLYKGQTEITLCSWSLNWEQQFFYYTV